MALRYSVKASLWPALSADISCSLALSMICLICSDFISILLCGALAPRRQRTEEGRAWPRRTATDVTEEQRLARACACEGHGRQLGGFLGPASLIFIRAYRLTGVLPRRIAVRLGEHRCGEEET